MTRRIVTFAAAALFGFSLVTASAQERPAPTQDTPPAGGGHGPGTVSSGGGGGGGGATSSAGVSTSSSGGTTSAISTPSGSGGGASWGESRSSSDFGARHLPAPMRYSDAAGDGQRAVPRGGGSGAGNGGGGRERAVPRGDSGNTGGGDNGGSRERAVPRGDRGDSAVGGRGRQGATMSIDDDARSRERNPVPAYSRPREGRTAVGSAIDRANSTLTGRGGSWYPYTYDSWYGYPYGSLGYYGYSSYYRYGFPGYGYGLGYFYDPFFFGYGYGSGGYGGGYGGGYYGGGGAGYYSRYDTGSLRLKISPRDAKVYIDGYFVGVVDSFDGVFQRLAVDAGSHRVEVRADGYEPVQFEVMITPGETVTYKGQMRRIQP
jgi:PEGA domain-containing protein